MSRGLLITVEGIDRCGKGTLTEHLERELPAFRVKFPRYEVEPVGPLVSKLLRKEIPEYQALSKDVQATIFQSLCIADRSAANREIQQRRNDGEHVILDRSWPSAYVYGMADGLSVHWMADFLATEYQMQYPDLMVLLDLPPEVAMKRRISGVAPERYDGVMAVQTKARETYLSLWNGSMKNYDGTGPRWVILDATQSPQRLYTHTREIINECITNAKS